MTLARKRSKPAKKRQHKVFGRNFCTASQREAITPTRASLAAPYTPPSPDRRADPTPSPVNHKMTDEQRLECWTKYVNWVLAGRKMADSPVPELKLK